MDLPQGPHTQLFLDPLGAHGALVASAQATESCPSIFLGSYLDHSFFPWQPVE